MLTIGLGAPKPAVSSEGSAKVMSIGVDMQSQAKVLSNSSTGSANEDGQEQTIQKEGGKADAQKNGTAEAAAKVTAAKAIEKTDAKGTASGSGTTSPTPSSGRSSPTTGGPTRQVRDADAVERDQTADVDDETLKEIYGKEHVNIIFIGHVDAGKSTLGGSILCVTGMVDQRTLDKYKREAKEIGRETWYLSWVSTHKGFLACRVSERLTAD